MAMIVSVSVAQVNENLLGATSAGETWGFPTRDIILRPTTRVIRGITMATIIQMIPAGTKVGSDQYYSPTALATILAAANV